MDPILTFITGALDKGGPALLAVVFAALYLRADAERRSLQGFIIEMHPKLLTTLTVIQSMLTVNGSGGSGRSNGNGGTK